MSGQTMSLDSKPLTVPTQMKHYEPAVHIHVHTLIFCLNANFSPVGTTTPFHGSGSSSVPSVLKGQQQPYAAPHNTLDSTAPRVKRGKEREIPKVKRPTALKKVNDLSWNESLGRRGRKMLFSLHKNWGLLKGIFEPANVFKCLCVCRSIFVLCFHRSSWRNVKGRGVRQM